MQRSGQTLSGHLEMGPRKKGQTRKISETEQYPGFVPTFKFQELNDWQQVPVGCITQINMTTGKKYCKLDPNYLQDPEYGIPACIRKKQPRNLKPQTGKSLIKSHITMVSVIIKIYRNARTWTKIHPSIDARKVFL